jgi:predicted alpha/beta-hydrolase family hydrolase
MKLVVGNASTEATLYRASERKGPALILAPGAGAGQTHPFMVRAAEGLASRGVDVMTFDFLYMHARRRLPDRTDRLEACWREAIALARAELRPASLFVGGKSMGGRIASHIAAAGEPAVDGLVLLGYPLHPPKQPEKLRVAHLAGIRAPILCIQGERDEFGAPDDLRPHFPPSAQIVPTAGGHSFTLSEALLDRIARFLEART